MRWGVDDARIIAQDALGDLQPRWSHVLGVGILAEDLFRHGLVPEQVASAAWLHDIGYAEPVITTGMHALDGARHLARLGAPDALVALVAHHTGACYEADELGLLSSWRELPEPATDDLEALTLVDLVVGPNGAFVDPRERVAEILKRYSPDNPVHRAVSTSGHQLVAMAARAKRRLALPDEWPLTTAERVLQTHPHGRV